MLIPYATNTRKPTALEEYAVISAAPCRFFSAVISSTNAGKIYAQLHDAAAQPAANAVPLAFVEIDPTISGATTASGYFDFGSGMKLVNGAVVALSSTAASYTALGSNDALIVASFS